jgi:Tfp pilus assembly protein PilW
MEMNIIQKWTERFKAKISDNHGMTLLELLLTITIMMILLPATYGVFVMGYKVYEKINYDSQMREDADYVSTMIMNTLYSVPFDRVQLCNEGDTCLEIINDQETSVQKYEKENSKFYDITTSEKGTPESEKIVLTTSSDGNKKVFHINHHELTTVSGFTNSSIGLICSEQEQNGCTSGIIKLHFEVRHPKTKDVLTLESQFGF